MSETTVLVVANRTASTPALLAEVHRRRETCSFALMVPPEAESDWSVDDACRLVGRAADQEVDAVEPGANAVATIHDLVEIGLMTAEEAQQHHAMETTATAAAS